jgi:deoxyribonuclease-4
MITSCGTMPEMPSTLPDGRRLGAHLPVAGGAVAAAERAHAIGAATLQIFADNPTAWRRRSEPPADLPAFRERLSTLDIGPVAIHASYLINLAGPDDAFRERSVEVLASELRAAPAFGARFVNVHIGSHRLTGLAEGIDRIGEGVAGVLAAVDAGPDTALIALENSAGGGGGIGVTLEELEAVVESIARHGGDLNRVGLCLDTAHLWGGGLAIGDEEAVDALVDELDARMGIERLVMVHLNDSKAAFGSRLDRHQHLGAGEIGVAGLRRLLTSPRLARVAYYLETPGMDEGYDAINVARAHAIAAGEPLEILPPEAKTKRGGRAPRPRQRADSRGPAASRRSPDPRPAPA